MVSTSCRERGFEACHLCCFNASLCVVRNTVNTSEEYIMNNRFSQSAVSTCEIDV